MQLLLKQSDIETAVRRFVGGLGIEHSITSVDFQATRGPSGIIAEIELTHSDSVVDAGPCQPEDQDDADAPTQGPVTEAPKQEAKPEPKAAEKPAPAKIEPKAEAEKPAETEPNEGAPTPAATNNKRLFG